MVVVPPWQRLSEPLIAPGSAFTVTIVVVMQPEPREYVMVLVPEATPQNRPVVASMVATAGLLLLHVPPPAELVRVLH